MREILFRGKIPGLTDWAYGYYAKSGENHFILLDTDNEDNYSIVDPKTVGQFTGLYDNKGTRIFEGDIIAFRSSESIYEVAYDITDAKFIILLRNGKDSFLRFYNISAYYFSVIANKWDNPELLEVEE